MLGLLYGEFLLIDGGKAQWVHRKLRRVDRHRAAVVLAKLLQTPGAALHPKEIMQQNESVEHLSELIAYLVVNEWVDVSPRGDRLMLVSKAKRALRGYHVQGVETF
jgi:hypothetical protein